jgi:hypothetical protein
MVTQEPCRNTGLYSRLRASVIFVVVCSVCLLLSSSTDAGDKPTQEVPANQDIEILRPGSVVKRQMNGVETHVYRIPAKTGQFLHLVLSRLSWKWRMAFFR